MTNLDQILHEIVAIKGVDAVSIVNANNGLMLGSLGQSVDLEYASAGNTELYHAEAKIMKNLGIHEEIEDSLITLKTQYHIMQPIDHIKGVFAYLVLSRERGNLALARRMLRQITQALTL